MNQLYLTSYLVSAIAFSVCIHNIGVEKSTAQGLLNRLEKEGLVGAAKGRRINRIVNKKKLVAALPKFMLAKDDQSEGGDKEHNPSSTTPPQNVPPAIIEVPPMMSIIKHHRVSFKGETFFTFKNICPPS